MEEWRDIEGYAGYQVSNQGQVRSLDRVVQTLRGPWRYKGKVLKPGTDNAGCLDVVLGRGSNTKTVHSLVAKAFLGPYPDGHEICHGVNGVSDNSVENLRYGTHSSNELDKRRDGTHCGRPVIRGDGEVFISMCVAAEMLDCYPGNICAVCNGHRMTAGGFTWQYKEAA
jgi:hypothetical protein